MEWRSIRFDWNHARAFLVTAEEGSLSAAAKALGQTQPTVGRQVEALQSTLGVLLFERVGKRLVLTAAGRDLVGEVRDMAAAATRFSNAAMGRSDRLEGPILITASEVYCAYRLPPVIARLRREAPGIDINLVASNVQLDLLRREADIAIRNVRPEQADLVARRLADDRGHLYASEAYLASIGDPRTPEQLAGASFISFEDTDAMASFLGQLGIDAAANSFPIVTENHLVMWEMIKSGAGIGVITEAVGDATPGVRRVLPDMPTVMFPVWLTTNREVGMSRRVRFVFDLLAEEFDKS